MPKSKTKSKTVKAPSNPATRYKSWAIQYNYDYDTRDGEGNPKNPDPAYFRNFNSNQVISFDDWLNWRIWWLQQRVIFGQKQLTLLYKAIRKGYPNLKAKIDYSSCVIPKNKKQKDQKYGLLLGSMHTLDTRLTADGLKLEAKPKHIHIYVELDSGITESKAQKFFEPSRKENLKNVQSKVKYGRYLLHASESAFEKYKHNYGEEALTISNLPDAFCVHCVYHYLTLGTTKNSKDELKKSIDGLANWLNDHVAAGIITADNAINFMKMEFGATAVEDYRRNFKNSQKDYLQLLFDSQKTNGRNFELSYINGLGHAGKSDISEAVAKASDPYHRFFPTTIGGSRKTTDLANGWQGEPQLVIQEMDGFAEDFRTLASLFDPNHVSMASSRNSNVQLAVDRAYISNSAPEAKWVLDNLISHARYEKNEIRATLLSYLRELSLTPDELTRLDKAPFSVLNKICDEVAKKLDSDDSISPQDVMFEIMGSQYSTSDTVVDWAVQLVRRLTYNIQIFTPGQFRFDASKQYQRDLLEFNKPIDDFTLNQRITAVYPLKDLDLYLKQHNDLFHLPNLQHSSEDDGYFLEVDPNSSGYFATGLRHVLGRQDEPLSFDEFAKLRIPDLADRKKYIEKADKVKHGVIAVDTDSILKRIKSCVDKITFNHEKYINYWKLENFIRKQGKMLDHLMHFDPEIAPDPKGDVKLIAQLLEEDADKMQFSYDADLYDEYARSIDSLKSQYESYLVSNEQENLQILRVASYNQALASCPLFADDPVNDSIILISKYNPDAKRMVTGCAIGLGHCADYKDYRKKVEEAGMAIAKVQGTYQPEAEDYMNPNEVKARLIDIAQNGLGS